MKKKTLKFLITMAFIPLIFAFSTTQSAYGTTYGKVSVGGTPIAGSEYSPALSASKAFDSDESTLWRSEEYYPEWLGYQLSASSVVKKYRIQAGPGEYYWPKTWHFYGSNDGSSWTYIQTESGQTWEPYEWREFTVDNTTSYLYYRIKVVLAEEYCVWDEYSYQYICSAYVDIGELELYALTPTATFSADPTEIDSSQSSTLTWSTENATTVTIDQGIGSVDASGSTSVSPDSTTTYTLTAQSLAGTVYKYATVTVHPTASISADPGTINPGHPSTLSWSTTTADTVYIDQGVGYVGENGSLDVFPMETKTYTITATGDGTPATDSVQVIVEDFCNCSPQGTLSGVIECGGILETQGTVLNGTSATLVAGHKIVLQPGFYAEEGSTFTAIIDQQQLTDNDPTGSDGMSDCWELEHFGDLTHVASGDEDEDGLTNIQEYQNYTDPLDPDTDGDGMLDGWEVQYGLNPLNASDASLDSDGDGSTNLQEHNSGTDPTDPDSYPRPYSFEYDASGNLTGMEKIE